MTTITGPTQFTVLNPEDQDGQPLDFSNASATITLYDQLAATVILPTTAMAWSVAAGTWVYDFDPTALAAGRYELRIVVTPTAGLPVPLWDLIEYAPGPIAPTTTQPVGVPPASLHFLEPYCVEADIPNGRLTDSNGSTISDVSIAFCIAAATDALYKRTRRKFRSGRSIIRPTQIVNPFNNSSMLYPYRSMAGFGEAWGFGDMAWSALGVGWWQGQDLSEIVLQAPVRKINTVTVDGDVLAASAYTVYDRRRLVRMIDGGSGGAWPWNQAITQPITEPGTWQIDYEWGRSITPLGKAACIELALSIAQELSGQDSSALPTRVTRVSSQGVDVGVGDALDFLKEGYTGLPIVDLFIDTENPTHSRKKARFLAPNSVLNRQT